MSTPYTTPSAPSIAQTMSVGGKTVHMIAKGTASYSATNGVDDILINGKKLDLSGGDEFTVESTPTAPPTCGPGKPYRPSCWAAKVAKSKKAAKKAARAK